MRLAALYVWIEFALRFFRIRDEFVSGFLGIADARWVVGSLEISAGGVIVFAIAISLKTRRR